MKRGFSLVELSIVLVILGLLVGGVLSGQSLIRASQLRAVTTEYNRYYSAVQTFRDKYFALPGDMTNAATFWGAADGSTGSTAACATAAGTGTQTCNGNGDGFVWISTSSNETFQFWRQLANAGLIEGNYDGLTHGGTTYSATTANSPSSKLGNSTIWFVNHWGDYTASNQYLFSINYTSNSFLMGGVLANGDPFTPVLKPEEAWNIDTKMDDGMPGRGKVIARNYPNGAAWSSTTCSNAATSQALGATYLLGNTGLECDLMFINLF